MAFFSMKNSRRWVADHIRKATILRKALGMPLGHQPQSEFLLNTPEAKRRGITFSLLQPSVPITQCAETVSLGDEIWPTLHQPFHYDTSSVWVAKIPRARILGGNIAVMTPEGVVLEDVSIDWGANQGNHRVMRQICLPRKKRISGQVAVLASTGSANYYHWLFDVLPRLEILRKAGFLQNPNLTFILERPLNKFQRESLSYYGFSLPRVFFLQDFPHIECEEMILPSLPGRIGDVPPWVCDFLRGPQLGLTPTTKKKNLYFITRRNTTSRNLLNEELILNTLASFGVQSMEPQDLSFPEQVELFAHADVVIGPHGAGLANIVFCKPKSYVIELIPSEYRNKCYWALSANIGLRYAYSIGEPSQNRLGRKESVSFKLSENSFLSIQSFLQRVNSI